MNGSNLGIVPLFGLQQHGRQFRDVGPGVNYVNYHEHHQPALDMQVDAGGDLPPM